MIVDAQQDIVLAGCVPLSIFHVSSLGPLCLCGEKGFVMSKDNATSWRLDRRVNLSVLMQLIVLVSLILGSWVNLQRQLGLLQHDVAALLQSQKEFQQRLQTLSERSLSCEYRLQTVEKQLADVARAAP